MSGFGLRCKVLLQRHSSTWQRLCKGWAPKRRTSSTKFISSQSPVCCLARLILLTCGTFRLWVARRWLTASGLPLTIRWPAPEQGGWPGAEARGLPRRAFRWQQTFPRCCQAEPHEKVDHGQVHLAGEGPFSMPLFQQPHAVLERSQVWMHPNFVQACRWCASSFVVCRWRVASSRPFRWIPAPLECGHLEAPAWGGWESNCIRGRQAEEAALQQIGLDCPHHEPRFDHPSCSHGVCPRSWHRANAAFRPPAAAIPQGFVAEAMQWGEARQQAAAERQSEWSTLCATADKDCPHGHACSYNHAAAAFFAANSMSLSRVELAVALRNILVTGPAKTTRVPMIVGATNSGKSTLVLPFDELYGFAHVFHKPALGSSFALRNLPKEKKFLFWDDFRPVEYGQRTVPVTTFLSLFQGQPFEVQMSQAFNDGNTDFEWHRGCVLTGKAKDLWKPLPGVDEEDIKHMKSRLLIFTCREPSRLCGQQVLAPYAWASGFVMVPWSMTLQQPWMPPAFHFHYPKAPRCCREWMSWLRRQSCRRSRLQHWPKNCCLLELWMWLNSAVEIGSPWALLASCCPLSKSDSCHPCRAVIQSNSKCSMHVTARLSPNSYLRTICANVDQKVTLTIRYTLLLTTAPRTVSRVHFFFSFCIFSHLLPRTQTLIEQVSSHVTTCLKKHAQWQRHKGGW